MCDESFHDILHPHVLTERVDEDGVVGNVVCVEVLERWDLDL